MIVGAILLSTEKDGQKMHAFYSAIDVDTEPKTFCVMLARDSYLIARCEDELWCEAIKAALLTIDNLADQLEEMKIWPD